MRWGFESSLGHHAEVAELADARGSEPRVLTGMWVRVPPSVPRGPVAQRSERRLVKPEVVGSNPIGVANFVKEESMKLIEIHRRVREIGGISVNDAEKAHAREDTLWSDVLQAIADGDHADIDPAVLARAALKTVELSFPRW